MTFIIINGEIDLSVGSMMGLSACAFGWMVKEQGVAAPAAIAISLGIGVLGGALNGWFITRVGLPSLVVTLATLIGFRGLARVLVEDRGLTDFPDWFDALGQKGLIGPLPFALIAFAVLFLVLYIVLERSGFGRKTQVIGTNREVAEFAGIDTNRHKMILFIASGTIAAFAGLLYAARVGAVRGDVANGFELDIITIVLLGGVSIFGGTGSLIGTLLAILIVLNIRNGMALLNITGHIQTGVIGLLLIASVIVPRLRLGAARENAA
jgi:rhamnose transport system permease protein